MILEQRYKMYEVQGHYILQTPKGSLLEGGRVEGYKHLAYNLDSITPVLSSYEFRRPDTTSHDQYHSFDHQVI